MMEKSVSGDAEMQVFLLGVQSGKETLRNASRPEGPCKLSEDDSSQNRNPPHSPPPVNPPQNIPNSYSSHHMIHVVHRSQRAEAGKMPTVLNQKKRKKLVPKWERKTTPLPRLSPLSAIL